MTRSEVVERTMELPKRRRGQEEISLSMGSFDLDSSKAFPYTSLNDLLFPTLFSRNIILPTTLGPRQDRKSTNELALSTFAEEDKINLLRFGSRRRDSLSQGRCSNN